MNRNTPFFVLGLGIVTAIVAISLPGPSHPKKVNAAFKTSDSSPITHNQGPTSRAVNPNPEAIPDQIAYTLLLRLITQHQADGSEVKKEQVRSYIGGMGLQESDIDALLATSELFKQRVGELDNRAKEIKDRTWPNPPQHAWEDLRSLQRQKEAAVGNLIASLPNRISPDGMRKLRAHLDNRVKRLTKTQPNPPTLPGGPGWTRHPHGRPH